MRDPAINLKVAAAVDEAERFLRARRQWLVPTRYDWSDVDKRALATLCHGGSLPARSASGRLVEISFRPVILLPDDVRAVILKRIAEPALLPRGRGRHQTGKYRPRNVAIVQAIELIRRRGFAAIDGEPSAAAIVRRALKRLGVALPAQRTIDDIWSKRRVRSNSAN